MANLTDENIAPRLTFLLNELNEIYYKALMMQFQHPIKDGLLIAIEDLIHKLIKDIEQEYPQVEIVGNLNGYNIIKKQKQ